MLNSETIQAVLTAALEVVNDYDIEMDGEDFGTVGSGAMGRLRQALRNANVLVGLAEFEKE